MAKAHSLYVCQQCGYESAGYLGKCPNCEAWGSLIETVVSQNSKSQNINSKQASNLKIQNLSEIKLEKNNRISTQIEELDRAMGGGIVSGQVMLLAGIPGIGKSTLLLQLANNLGNVMYVSGEESTQQIAMRAERLGVKSLPAGKAGNKINIIEETDIDAIIGSVQDLNLDLLIIDSIQTMATADLSGMAGSVGQVRECAFRLVRFAKSKNVPVFIVGHVTKEGTVAGPSVLAHIVDTVLWFEGDKSLTIRMIRATKNRFGPTDEVGVFEMQGRGLISVSNPEKFFLTNGISNVPGRVVSALMQGSRPVLVEIESLVTGSKLAFPKRIAQGVDPKRFELLLAVLTKHCKLPLYEYDCFVNVAGGITARDPSIDLAICMSIASSFFDKAITSDVIAIGEVGLLGEVREIIAQDKIVKLARRLGYGTQVTNKEFKLLPQIIHNFFVSAKRAK